jgi:hypothetical protein
MTFQFPVQAENRHAQKFSGIHIHQARGRTATGAGTTGQTGRQIAVRDELFDFVADSAARFAARTGQLNYFRHRIFPSSG